jgi:hypothetical protein
MSLRYEHIQSHPFGWEAIPGLPLAVRRVLSAVRELLKARLSI